jgi:hypothetical protein
VHRLRELSPNPTAEELEETYQARPEGSFSPERAIEEQIEDLEAWVRENVRAERWALFRFWCLRGFALFGAMGAIIANALSENRISIICAAVAAIAVAIDAASPTGANRQSRRRANRDLRELQQTLKIKWDKVRLAYPDRDSTKRIGHALTLLDAAHARREEIGKYLDDAPSSVKRSLAG